MSSETSLFDMFDGVRPMARELNERPSNVQDWKNNGRIPAGKQAHVLSTAIRLKLPVTALHVIFPTGIPVQFINAQLDLFDRDAPSPVPPAHGRVVTSGAPIVACDRSAVLHPVRQ